MIKPTEGKFWKLWIWSWSAAKDRTASAREAHNSWTLPPKKRFFFVFFTVWYPAFCLPKTLFLWKVFHFLFFFQKSILWDLCCIIYEYNQNYGLVRICHIGEFDDKMKRTLFIRMVIAFVEKGEMFSKRFGWVGSAINSQLLVFLLLFLLRACDLYLVWHLREKKEKKIRVVSTPTSFFIFLLNLFRRSIFVHLFSPIDFCIFCNSNSLHLPENKFSFFWFGFQNYLLIIIHKTQCSAGYALSVLQTEYDTKE